MKNIKLIFFAPLFAFAFIGCTSFETKHENSAAIADDQTRKPAADEGGIDNLNLKKPATFEDISAASAKCNLDLVVQIWHEVYHSELLDEPSARNSPTNPGFGLLVKRYAAGDSAEIMKCGRLDAVGYQYAGFIKLGYKPNSDTSSNLNIIMSDTDKRVELWSIQNNKYTNCESLFSPEIITDNSIYENHKVFLSSKSAIPHFSYKTEGQVDTFGRPLDPKSIQIQSVRFYNGDDTATLFNTKTNRASGIVVDLQPYRECLKSSLSAL